MLLTSSQVSVAVSSFVVFLFTSALFLSGYVLQQQTVRDLRAVIKPQLVRPPPDLYLPPQFRDDVLGLTPAAEERYSARERMTGGVDGESSNRESGDTRAANDSEENEDIGTGRRGSGGANKQLFEDSQADMTQRSSKQDEESTERASTQNAALGDSRSSTDELPLSRAARRKKIKQEILAAGEGEGFKGYKRRMW